MIHHSYNKFVYLNNNVICPITSFSSLPTTEFSFEPSLAKGFITGSRLSIETCDDDRSLLRNLNWYTYSKTGYDYEGRPDCCVSSSALSGFYIQTTTGYTRQGHVTETDSKYLTPYSLTYCVGESFSTDALGNPTSQSARLGLKQSGYAERNLSSLKLDIAYNALGKPSRKSTAGNSVTIDYGYNMRGMLSSISSTAFSQSVFYNDGLSPCYNGNISGITNTYGSGTPVAVQFSYDRLNRLTASLSSDGYNTAYSYSLNSSPLSVLRRGLLSDGTVGTVDELTLTYSGNRLTKTVDSADPVLLENSMDFAGNESVYSYDADGRMTADSGRGITSISYNRFDRPKCIEMENGTCIFYAYDATGQKIAEMYRNGYTTDTRHYIGQGELTVSNSNTPSFSRVNFDWGYINSRNTPQLFIKDYQGNVRAVVDTLGKAVQTTDYYPYGLPKATATAPSVNRYKYSAKELETRNGLNQYDFLARIYSPAVPMFTRPDDKAIDYPATNPYLYCAANPINIIDPNGMDGVRLINNNEKSITIKGNYYMVTGSAIYKGANGNAAYLTGYSTESIELYKTKVNDKLNGYNLKIPSGQYNGYSLKFDLDFKDGKESFKAEYLASSDVFEGYSIGNVIQLGSSETHKNINFEKTIQDDGSYSYVGGVTDQNKHIVMNIIDNNLMNLIHEIMHTLGLSHPKGSGASHGIMSYPPSDLDNDDALELSTNPFLPTISL